MGERLQKILANTGFGSRRELERWISDGLIRINGREAKLGDRATLNDDLVIKGRFYKVVDDDQREARQVLRYHKPLGELTTRDDPEGRRTVFDRLPRLAKGRWISVGRLDINTLGLLCTGVELEDGLTKFDRIKAEDHGEGINQWFNVTVKQGKNRVVRRLWESQDLQVSRLIRTRYGSVSLPKWLSRGKMELLGKSDVDTLVKMAGLDARPSDNLRIIPVHPRHKRKAQKRRR